MGFKQKHPQELVLLGTDTLLTSSTRVSAALNGHELPSLLAHKLILVVKGNNEFFTCIDLNSKL